VTIAPAGTIYLGLDASGNPTATTKSVTASESGWSGGFTATTTCIYVALSQAGPKFTLSQETAKKHGDSCSVTITGAPGASTTVQIVSTYTGVVIH
jgi:hypothetical protein